MVVQARAAVRLQDNTRHWGFNNAVVLLKRRGLFKSKYLYGPLSRAINKKQYLAMFDEVL